MDLPLDLKYFSRCLSPLIRCAVAGLALLPAAAMALSVGPIQVMSNLNQALIADISLSNFGDLDETQIKINLAENIYFTKAGVYKASWLSDLNFVVIKNPDDTGVLQLRTKNPIKDPVVDLLINIAWPSGKMIRQYTVLLDPSRVAVGPAQVNMGATKLSVQNHLSQPTSQIGFGQKYGPVTSEDNLWTIAHKMVAPTTYTAAQGVLAIYEKNLDAFQEQNMNKLKEGAILYLPEKFEVAQVSASEAGDKIVSAPKTVLPQSTNTSVQANSSPEAVSSQPLRDSKPLKILSPTDLEELAKKKPSDFTQLESSSVNNSQIIQQKLALLEEELDTFKRRNELIHEKNILLQQNNDKLTDAIVVKDSELDLLKENIHEQKSVQVNNAVQQDVSQSMAPNATAITNSKIQQPTQEQNTASPTNPVTNNQLAPVTTESSPNSSQWLFYILGILGLACAGGVWIWRKKKENANRFQQTERPETLSEIQPKPIGAQAGSSAMNYGLDFDMDEALSTMDIAEDQAETSETNEHLNAKFEYEATKQKYQETLENAELMIAYEKYADAEAILTTILAEAPKHWLALLRLLELYVVTKDNHQFYHWQKTVPEYLASIAPEVWSKIKFLDEKLQQDNLGDTELDSGTDSSIPNDESIEIDNAEKEERAEQPAETLEFELNDLTKEAASESDEQWLSTETKADSEQVLEFVLDKKESEQAPGKEQTAPQQKQEVSLEQRLSQLENLAALTQDSHSIELAKAFVLAGEVGSAKNLLIHLLNQSSEIDQKQAIEQLLVEID
tara:strand:- start:13732 stop:16089 length:2358 start_codon:yes stop_codon:yes gene_type:complete